MSKELEKYIKENRRAFDTDVPSDQLWDRIESELAQQKVKKPLRLSLGLWIAASLLFVLSITLIYRQRNVNTGAVDIADINPAYAKKEMKFASLIEEKKDSLQIYARNNPVLYSQFSADLNKLGTDYEHLKKELQDSPNQKLVVKAMVKNLELQLQVISQQLLIINKVNEIKKENKI